MTTPDFGRLAADYDRVRPVDDGWWEVFDALVETADLRGRRVLDVGCGTGRLVSALTERAHARAWGVDASAEMLAVARENASRAAGLRQGAAERLPFKDGWFERVAYWLSVHLLDRPAAFAEARRVLAPDGAVAVVTFDRAYFDGFWLNRLFPSMRALDLARFPSADDLAAELGAAGFAPPVLRRVSQRRTQSRETALDRIRNRHISTFDLISEDEYREGLSRAERELAETFEYPVEWLVAAARAR